MSVSPEPLPTEQHLDTPTRLKLARGIIDRTCQETGAGYLLLMFVPGTDLVMRSWKGLDTPDECLASAKEVVALMKAEALRLHQTNGKALHNDN